MENGEWSYLNDEEGFSKPRLSRGKSFPLQGESEAPGKGLWTGLVEAPPGHSEVGKHLLHPHVSSRTRVRTHTHTPPA